MTTNQSCAPAQRNHFQGNGSCDAAREANKRADHQAAAATGMESEIAPYTAAELQQMQSGGAFGQLAPYNGAESDMIYDGYGTDHDHTGNEEDGMTSIPQDSFNEPLTADEAARNSWRALLARNVGRNVLVQFLMGTQNMVTVEGELYEVGTDYIVIYQPLWDSHITADLYSVKFVEFREPPGGMILN
ncbi:MAG: hypothetical protein IJV43_07045 [Oscillospiraceae bacterium]|nr:hypothetical protein [Oscillospiraceae bacterium]